MLAGPVVTLRSDWGWRIHLQGGSLPLLIYWCQLFEGGLSSSPSEPLPGLLELSHGMALDFPIEGGPGEEEGSHTPSLLPPSVGHTGPLGSGWEGLRKGMNPRERGGWGAFWMTSRTQWSLYSTPTFCSSLATCVH